MNIIKFWVKLIPVLGVCLSPSPKTQTHNSTKPHSKCPTLNLHGSEGLLMPGQLPPDTVGNGGNELATKTKLGCQGLGKLFRTILWLRNIPLELIVQWHISNVDIQLDNNPLVGVLLVQHVTGMALQLLLDWSWNRWYEGHRVQILKTKINNYY